MKIRLFFQQTLLFFAFLSIALPTYALSNKDAVLDRVVAIVNDEAIPESALDRQMQLVMTRIKQNNMSAPPEDQLRKQLLERMILEKLQLQKAKEVSVAVEDTELNNAINDIAKRDHLTLPDLKKSVEGQGIPFSQFRDTIKTELTILKLQYRELGQSIQVSNAEIEQFLQSPAAQDQNNAEYHLSHILIPLPEMPTERMDLQAKKEANDIIHQLHQGANFSELAMAKSSAPNAMQGGDLGWRKTPELPTLFAKIVPSLQVGTIHGPIRNDSGYHIIKLVDKRIDGVQAIHTETIKKSHVRQILIKPSAKVSDNDAQRLLTQLREEIIAGADFNALAQKHSQETPTAAKAGDLGWISKEMVVPEFYSTLSTLGKGELSQPFKTALGWHLIQVIDTRHEKVASEAFRNKAKDIITQRKMDERLGIWLRRLRDESEVVVNLN